MPFVPKEEREKVSYDERKNALKKNELVRRPLGRLGKNFGRSKHGAEKQFTVARMRNGINKYFKRCEDRDEVPSLKGMMLYLDMHPSAFYKYLAYPDFTDLMETARLMILHWIELDVYATNGRPDAKIAYMKNVHGWTDKIETKNETLNVNANIAMTPEQAREKIARLAPMLLEMLDNQRVVDQVAPKVIEVEEAPKRIGRRV